MAAMWYPARLIRSEPISQYARQFYFELEADAPVRYRAGQFFVFDLPTGSKRSQRWRSYSMANRCNGNNIIECTISYKPGGLASEYLFTHIKEGDLIKIKGPEGTFVLPDQTDCVLYFIGTGTGMAPYRAMIQDMIHQGLQYNAVHWVFGSRKMEDILYASEWQYWIERIPNFSIDICLSREESLPQNQGAIRYHRSYVHKPYLQKLQGIGPEELAKTMFYLCGWSPMIDEALLHLQQQVKADRRQIKLELYG